jgi:hypothetical protein
LEPGEGEAATGRCAPAGIGLAGPDGVHARVCQGEIEDGKGDEVDELDKGDELLEDWGKVILCLGGLTRSSLPGPHEPVNAPS